MSNPEIQSATPGRRHFFGKAGLALLAAPFAKSSLATGTAATGSAAAPGVEPFWGTHQAGIDTPMQGHTYFVAFDVTSTDRAEVIRLLKAWTDTAARMTQSEARLDPKASRDLPGDEPGSSVGLPVSRLTITFGFGPTLFEKDGVDRFGLAARRPQALVDLPRFAGDQLVPGRTGGDLSVQACADNPQVVETAVRRLAKLASGVATMRWAQMGFSGSFRPDETARNQMGFKDGTRNISAKDPAEMNKFIWVGEEGPAWLRNGTYMVIRPVRIDLEHWDEMKLAFQEETVGRHKLSGAPIGKIHERDEPDLAAEDKDGNPVITENSHLAMAAPETNDGAKILRRAYNFDNGVAQIAERWPPWRQHVTFDAGLLFECYQRDPRTGFIRIFQKMAQIDMLNQFTTHVGSGLFACPPGAAPGEFVGQALFT